MEFSKDREFSKEKEGYLSTDVESIISGTTISPSNAGFSITKSLHISSKGVSAFECSRKAGLQTAVLDSNGNTAYISTKEKWSSGNCTLSDAQGRQVLRTTYFFGPRDPIMHILNAGEEKELKTSSKWTSRRHHFHLPDGRTCTWAYKKGEGFGDGGKKGTALVLELEGRCIAALIRNKETRTPGSSRWGAGNGGQLALGEDVGASVSEEFVVASCMLMLKKEGDRGMQAEIAAVS